MPIHDCPEIDAAYRSALLVNEFTLKSCEVLDRSEVNKNALRRETFQQTLYY